MKVYLGEPHSEIRRQFVEEGPWQICSLCGEQSGSWEWLEEHILRCGYTAYGEGPDLWRGKWCPACSDEMEDDHDPDTCVDERIAT
ncbi:MAG: hypothetical protein NTZ05_15450 [Chloroflexi bacterium]|nr:hypothetical protein [Chloroflexota bacterium]